MIIRSDKNKNYTTICNIALNDPNLSLKAKGLWAFIMTKPDDWRVSSRGLASQLKEGRDAIMSAMKELEETGYLQRGRHRQEDGRWSTEQNILYEKPVAGNYHHEKPNHIVNTEKVITENKKINKKNPKIQQTQLASIEDSGTSSIGAKAPTSLSADVENTTPTDKTKETLLAAIAIVNPIEKATESRMSLMRARLKEYTPDEILASAKALSKSEWHRQNKQMSIDNLIRPSKIGRWYNESQSPQNTERQMYM